MLFLIPSLNVGDQVLLRYKSNKNASRKGVITFNNSRFFTIHFGLYQEGFLWVDIMIGEISVVKLRKPNSPMHRLLFEGGSKNHGQNQDWVAAAILPST